MKARVTSHPVALQMAILDVLPNPVLVKNAQLQYVLVNRAFEELFGIQREQLMGKLDQAVFKERQIFQCNAGDRRVLELGEIDEAFETVFPADSAPREIITRKSRLVLPDGQTFLVGVIHDITEVTTINRKLKENQTLLQKQSEALARMANTDSLTGCGNRRSFYTTTTDKLANYNNIGSLLLLDIDHFKQINDAYGHDVGDLALVHLVKTIAQTLQGDEEIVRLGGEEFVVILPGTTLTTSMLRAEQIRQVIDSAPVVHRQLSIPMTVSIGIAQTSALEPINLDTLLIQADQCLYQAKANGRNQVVAVENQTFEPGSTAGECCISI